MIAEIVYTGYSTLDRLDSGAINRFLQNSASSLVQMAFKRALN